MNLQSFDLIQFLAPVWDALRRVGMAAPLGAVEDVDSVPTSSTCEVRQAEIAWITSLDMAVEDGGRNFSMGMAAFPLPIPQLPGLSNDLSI